MKLKEGEMGHKAMCPDSGSGQVLKFLLAEVADSIK